MQSSMLFANVTEGSRPRATSGATRRASTFARRLKRVTKERRIPEAGWQRVGSAQPSAAFTQNRPGPGGAVSALTAPMVTGVVLSAPAPIFDDEPPHALELPRVIRHHDRRETQRLGSQ